MRRFPKLDVQRVFLQFPGGSSDPHAFPYILKGRGTESGLSSDKKAGVFTRKRPPRPKRLADRQAGQPLTYPAIVISEV